MAPGENEFDTPDLEPFTAKGQSNCMPFDSNKQLFVLVCLFLNLVFLVIHFI